MNGENIYSVEDIKAKEDDWFKNFLQQEPSDYVGTSVNEIEYLVDFRCDEDMQQKLMRPVLPKR